MNNFLSKKLVLHRKVSIQNSFSVHVIIQIAAVTAEKHLIKLQ